MEGHVWLKHGIVIRLKTGAAIGPVDSDRIADPGLLADTPRGVNTFRNEIDFTMGKFAQFFEKLVALNLQVGKATLAEKMHTSRAQVDRILKAKGNITIDTLQRAAALVGRELRLELI